jgi:hypothetical protein
MDRKLPLHMLAQPDDTACGPTCLQAVYAYWGLKRPVSELINEIHYLPSGGTLAVFLANHALEAGFRVHIYTWNLNLFDPTWFHPQIPDLGERLIRQAEAKPRARLRAATRGYLRFLELGGKLHYEDLSAGLLGRILDKGLPVLAGLSSTYLYRARREAEHHADDVLGEPEGHFVVLHGLHRKAEQLQVDVADPYEPNPIEKGHHYRVGMERLLGALMLGVLTHDANFLVIEAPPRKESSWHS